MNCWLDEKTVLDTLINIQGYYSEKIFRDNTGLYGFKNGKFVELEPDTSVYNMIFFDDGIFIGNVGFRGVSMEDGLKQMYEDSISFDDRVYYQGTYQVRGEIIVVHKVSPGYGNVWIGQEDWYMVQDKNTLLHILSKPMGASKYDLRREDYQPVIYDPPRSCKFTPVVKMPESKSWLQNEKWFRCE